MNYEVKGFMSNTEELRYSFLQAIIACAITEKDYKKAASAASRVLQVLFFKMRRYYHFIKLVECNF